MRLAAALLLAQYFELAGDCGGPPPVNDPPADAVAQGGDFGCNVTAGVARCYGKNDRGQLGRGDSVAQDPRAADVIGLPEPVAQLVAGDTGACARTLRGRVFCWGANDTQQLGRAEPATSSTPVEVNVPVPVARLSMGASYVLALGSDGRLFGWGDDTESVFGRGEVDPGMVADPKPVVRAAFDLRLTDISAGQGHACGIDRQKTLWCWGRNGFNELGAGRPEPQVTAPVRSAENVTAVAANSHTTCAVRDGQLWCSGRVVIDNGMMALDYRTPTRIQPPAEAAMVDGYWFHHCMTTPAGELYCWGRGLEGQLGLGANFSKPFPLPSLTDVAEVAVGRSSTCARKKDGSVWCTGLNGSGQLGLGDLVNRNTFARQ